MSECNVSKVVQKHNRETAECEAADKLARMLEEMLDVQPTVAFAVCGGRSVEGVFERLAEKDIEWSRIHIFLADERFVPLGDAESNFSLVHKLLIDPRSCTMQEANHPDWDEKNCIPSANIHPFDAEKGIAAYEKELLVVRPHFDVLLLSSGEDGHIGALFPDHHSLRDEAPLFIEMEDSPKPPAHRMSLSAAHVQKAHSAVVMFLGESKRNALRAFRMNNSSCPATLVNSTEHAYAITDLG